MTQTTEIINSQVAIINWLQRQATQGSTSLTQTKELIKLLKQVIDCYEILLNVEERRQPSRLVVEQMPTQPVNTGGEDSTSENKNVNFFSLEEAYKDAVENGCTISQGVFRKRLTEGACLYGWRKDVERGNRPSYYKVF